MSPLPVLIEKIMEAIKHFEPEGKQRDVFGDGRAAESIVEILASRSSV